MYARSGVAQYVSRDVLANTASGLRYMHARPLDATGLYTGSHSLIKNVDFYVFQRPASSTGIRSFTRTCIVRVYQANYWRVEKSWTGMLTGTMKNECPRDFRARKEIESASTLLNLSVQYIHRPGRRTCYYS